jgi:outer membrane protein
MTRPCCLACLATAALALAARTGAAATATTVAAPPPPATPTPTTIPGATPRTTAAPLRTLTLAEVERAALSRQPQVLVARAATDVAEAQVEQATAPMLPQVSATGQYLRTTGNYAPRPGALPSVGGVSVSTSTSYNPQFDSWLFSLSATQLLYDFGQTSERRKAALATADAQRSGEQVTRLQVLSNVRRTYFAARAARDLVDVARETLVDQQRHLLQVQGFVTVGTQPPIALAQQKAAVANAQVSMINAANNYETAKAQLNQAAGLTGGTEYEVTDETLPPLDDEDQPLDVLVPKALAARPELAQIDRERASQEAILASVRGAYGPTLSATAGATEQGTALDGLVPNWQFGALVNWNILQGGLTRGQVHQASATLSSLDAQRSLLELQVRLDVDAARLAVSAAKASIAAAEDARSSAQEQLRQAEQRYATGVGSIIELNDAQVAYTSAAAQAVGARYTLAGARAQLLAALGRT